MPGKQSGQQSKEFGDNVKGLINDVGGDQAKEILPTACKITNSGGVKYIGDSIVLSVETEPEDANRKSYYYQSSNLDVATVNENGEVNFIGIGTVSIRATNLFSDKIFDSVEFDVREIECESITSKVSGLKLIDNSYYELEFRNSSGYTPRYKILNEILPENTTNKNITYEVSDDTILRMSDDYIIPLMVSSELVTLRISIGDKYNILNFKIVDNYVEPDLELISISSSNITKYIDQTTKFKPTVYYTPTNTIYKGFDLESSDSEIINVRDDGYLEVKGVGVATITITSTRNEEIKTTITITVKNRTSMTSFTPRYSQKMYVGSTQNISISTSPAGVLIKTKVFESLDPEIISVNSSGKLTANNIGSANIKITVTDSNSNVIEQTITVESIEKPLETADDFDIKYLVNQVPVILADTEINLNDYFGIDKFYNSGNPITMTDKSFKFEFDGEELESSVITFTKNGLQEGYIVYTNEDLTTIKKDISLYAISDFEVIGDDGYLLEYNINVGDGLNLAITSNQEFDILFNKPTLVSKTVSTRYISLTAIKSGKLDIIITPRSEEYDLSEFSKVIKVNITDITNDTFDVSMKASNGNNIEERYITLSKNDTLTFDYLYNEDANLINVEVTNSNPNSLRIRNNTITALRCDDIDLVFKESYSNITVEYKIFVRNIIKLNEDKPVIISGNYNYKNDTLTIINGETVRIRFNFDSSSTYKSTHYSSSDENIIVIGSDGVITPKKKGSATITLSANDGYENITLTLNIKVERKNITDNIQNFYLYIRKGFGHFGAFLVLGIISTVLFIMLLRKKLYILGIAINFVSGFLVAGITEIIQLYVPGRSGLFSDVIIDYTGFISSAITLTIIITAILLIRIFIRKKKEVAITNENIKLTEEDLLLEDYKD